MKKVVYILLSLILLSVSVHAQVEEALEQMTSELAEGYFQPFVDAFGNNLNAGITTSAKIPSIIGLDFSVGVTLMGTIIPDEDLTYDATPPTPYPQTSVETATVFGEKGAVVDGPSGLKYAFQDGQVQGNFAPLAIPQISIGSVMGTKILLRYFASDLGEGVGELGLVGYGIQHNISQYIPLFPVSVSASFFMQNMQVGDIVDANLTSIGIQASKKLAILTVYGGASINNTTMDLGYTYDDGQVSEDVSVELESTGNFRITVGGQLKLGPLYINGDYNMGNQNTIVLGVGVGI